MVSAAAAREHLLSLLARGVGARAVSDVTDLDRLTLWRIRSGRRKQIRLSTEQIILAVDDSCVADGALVDAGPTWRRIEHLVDEGGFTKKEIARRLGQRSPAIQFRKNQVKASTALKVERFHHYYMVKDRSPQPATRSPTNLCPRPPSPTS